MKGLVAVIAVAVFLGASAAAPRNEAKQDAPKIDPAKVIGTWEVVRSPGDVPVGALVTFGGDMTIKVSVPFNGMTIDVDGTYRVEGDKLVVTVRGPDGKDESDTDTIKLLDGKKMVIVDKAGKEAELTRR